MRRAFRYLPTPKSHHSKVPNVTSYILTVFPCHIHYGLTYPLNELPIKVVFHPILIRKY